MEQTGPRRSPPVGGYARGMETRGRIIEAAIQVFGREGFARASTREIAREAGVTPPSLQYYFDSKEGLHRACAEFIFERAWEALGPSIEAAEALEVATAPREVLVEHACAIMLEVAEGALGATRQMASWKAFIARGQALEDGPAYALIRERLVRRLHSAMARLVGAVFGAPQEDESVLLRSIAILGQISAFSVGRAGAMASLGWSDLSGDRVARIKAVLVEQTRAMLAASGGAAS